MVQTHGAGAGPNGNLLDAAGRLVTFRQGPAARDVVRQPPPDAGRTAEVRGVGDGKRIGEVALPAVEVLAARYEGRRLNGPNDGAVHPDGSIFFTDPNWGLVLANATASQELDVHGVYRLDATTNATAAPLRLVLEGLAMPNGIGERDPSVALSRQRRRQSARAHAEANCQPPSPRVPRRRLLAGGRRAAARRPRRRRRPCRLGQVAQGTESSSSRKACAATSRPTSAPGNSAFSCSFSCTRRRAAPSSRPSRTSPASRATGITSALAARRAAASRAGAGPRPGARRAPPPPPGP